MVLLRNVQWCHVQSLPIALSQVTLGAAVPGLSLDSLTPQHPCGRVSQNARVTPAVPGLSWDSLTPQHPCGRVSQNTGVMYTGSLGIILGLPNPPAPLWQSVAGLSWDSLPPSTMWQSIPGLPVLLRRSGILCHWGAGGLGSPRIIPGLPVLLWHTGILCHRGAGGGGGGVGGGWGRSPTSVR